MKPSTRLLSLWATICLCTIATPSFATDVDGGNDCQKDHRDFGDAPEVLEAYPLVSGHFPSCVNLLAPAGTYNISPDCAPRSTPPGLTGWVEHVDFGPPSFQNFWFGCYTDALGQPRGIDAQNGENEAKVNSPPTGFAFCAANQTTDCVEVAPWGVSYDQDECLFDGSDAGLLSSSFPVFQACQDGSIQAQVYNCGPTRIAYFNALLDMNSDGDWNDTFQCPSGCAYEWIARNQQVTLLTGCNTVSAVFPVGPNGGMSWLRITITTDAVSNDFPWAGSNDAVHGGGFIGGETEDYPATIERPVPVQPSTFGWLKAYYR